MAKPKKKAKAQQTPSQVQLVGKAAAEEETAWKHVVNEAEKSLKPKKPKKPKKPMVKVPKKLKPEKPPKP